MNDNVGIKITDTVFSAKIAKCIRKYRDIPISDIKEIVESQGYLMECDYIDEVGVKQILLLNNELHLLGYRTLLFEHDNTTSEEFLKNWINSMAEIAYEVEIDMEREADE